MLSEAKSRRRAGLESSLEFEEKAKKRPALCRAFFYECEVIEKLKGESTEFWNCSLRKKAGGLKTSAIEKLHLFQFQIIDFPFSFFKI